MASIQDMHARAPGQLAASPTRVCCSAFAMPPEAKQAMIADVNNRGWTPFREVRVAPSAGIWPHDRTGCAEQVLRGVVAGAPQQLWALWATAHAAILHIISSVATLGTPWLDKSQLVHSLAFTTAGDAGPHGADDGRHQGGLLCVSGCGGCSWRSAGRDAWLAGAVAP